MSVTRNGKVICDNCGKFIANGDSEIVFFAPPVFDPQGPEENIVHRNGTGCKKEQA